MLASIVIKRDSRFSNQLDEYDFRIQGKPKAIEHVIDSLQSEGWSVILNVISSELIITNQTKGN